MSLTLYTNPMSRGRIARWMIEEVGAPYETVVLGYADKMKAPDYLAINPMGKVPAIVHDGRVVTEVAAICAYLADAFPDAGLAPPPSERGEYYRWMFFAAGPVEQAVTNRSMGVTADEQKSRMLGYGTYDKVVEVMDQALTGREWIAGDAFSAADVVFGAQIVWGMQFQTIPKLDAFVAYVARLTARDAYKRAAALDDAAMPMAA
ncbi:glutathione S-transferase family protein [uncultured Sphingomonas sp.]|uniref:glutathione S-transferase family protein n=1 Tax=uncultured Sphingomonas sp. TaxID=158754 RepID=UPI0035CAAE14